MRHSLPDWAYRREIPGLRVSESLAGCETVVDDLGRFHECPVEVCGEAVANVLADRGRGEAEVLGCLLESPEGGVEVLRGALAHSRPEAVSA